MNRYIRQTILWVLAALCAVSIHADYYRKLPPSVQLAVCQNQTTDKGPAILGCATAFYEKSAQLLENGAQVNRAKLRDMCHKQMEFTAAALPLVPAGSADQHLVLRSAMACAKIQMLLNPIVAA